MYVQATRTRDKGGSCRSFWLRIEWIRRQKKWNKWRRKGKKLNLVSRRHIVLNILFHYTELCVFTRDYEFVCHSTVASYRIYCRSHFLSSSQTQIQIRLSSASARKHISLMSSASELQPGIEEAEELLRLESYFYWTFK